MLTMRFVMCELIMPTGLHCD